MKKTVKKILRPTKRMLQRLIIRILPFFHIERIDVSMWRACRNVISRGLNIKTIIDVGASDGSWSNKLMEIIPEAKYMLIEAQECHEEELKAFCGSRRNAQYILSAAGEKDGMCYFNDSDPFGGLASTESGFSDCSKEVPMRSIDSVIYEYNLHGPFLLKLDVHGFEVPILDGATECLKNAELVVIEAYIFRLNEKALLFHELCSYMYQQGFQCIDMADPLWREKDNALWQWDLFFIKKDSPIFRNNSWT